MQSQAADYYERVGRTYDPISGEWVSGIPASIGKPISAGSVTPAYEAPVELVSEDVGVQRAAILARQDTPLAAAMKDMPDPLRQIVSEIWYDENMNDAAFTMLENERSFESPTAALLTGIALNPAARAHYAKRLDEWWGSAKLLTGSFYPEVVVGGGLHAAIYAAVRVASGYPKPLVLERSERVGGTFAVTLEPSFTLNSANRPGDLSVPRQPGALNVLPGAPVQPSNLSGEDYQTNAQLAFAVRSALAMYAQVIPHYPVDEIRYPDYEDENLYLESYSQGTVFTNRIILATGLDQPRNPFGTSDRVLDWEEYMRRKESTRFPLQGMKRVAVIGAGDSGKTVVEDLLGQGPQSGWSVASKDWVEQIGWYGVPQTTRQSWEEVSRPRYRGIGRGFPDENGMNRAARIAPFRQKVGQVVSGYNNVYVDGVPYDYAVICTGYREGSSLTEDMGDGVPYRVSGRPVARSFGTRVITVGPAAALEVSDTEREVLAGIPENSTALFRYASQTAALAAFLPSA